MSNPKKPLLGVKNADPSISSEIQLSGMKTTPQDYLTLTNLAISHSEKASGEIVAEVPATNWTLEQIAGFVNELARRRAVDAWMIGKALSLAQAKHKGEKNFVGWLEVNVPFSIPTAYRWIRLSKRLTLEECQNRPVQFVYDIIQNQLAEEKAAKVSVNASSEVGISTRVLSPTPTAIGSSEPVTKNSKLLPVGSQSKATEKQIVATVPSNHLTWSVADEEEIEIEETLEKFQRSVENLEVYRLSERQRMVLTRNLFSLRAKVDALLLQLAA